MTTVAVRDMDRLGEITAPTLVLAGRDDFILPPEHQRQLAAGIPGARLEIIERAGHNPHDERIAPVMNSVRDFLSTADRVPADVADAPAKASSSSSSNQRASTSLQVGRARS